MIDEEDDEDVLKKGVSFKSVLKNLLVIILIGLGALFIYLGIFPDQTTNFMIGFMLICFGSTIIQIPKQEAEPIRQTLSILACNLCGLMKVRNFEGGDYVFKETEKCTKCNQPMIIKQIYSVRLKKPTEQKIKQEKVPKEENLVNK